MEHLLSPQGAKPIRVPYVCRRPYEQMEQYQEYPEHAKLAEMYPFGPSKDSLDNIRNFKSFFERVGWTRDSTGQSISCKGRTPEEILDFFQTYFYFGMLISVFRCVGIAVRTNDLVDASGNFLDTSKLPSLIAEWHKRENPSSFGGFAGMTGNFDAQKQNRGQNIMEMLHWTHWYTNGGEFGADAAVKPDENIFSLVKAALMALGESLASAMAGTYGTTAMEMPTWGPSPLLVKRLRDNDWCVSDTPFFPGSVRNSSISADYYFGGLVCPRPRGDHSGCSPVICYAYRQNVDTKTYKAKHRPDCKGCDYILAPEEFIGIVRAGGVPILYWDGESLTVSAHMPSMRYVAISHVWSDGLGNDDIYNQLPKCQLSRIQHLVKQQYAERHTSSDGTYLPELNPDEKIGFWLDTLCVPVGNHNVDLRKLAIRQMRAIYKNSDRTLVLDSFVQTLPREADLLEKYIRLHLSTWHHRLWTLQEGQLGQTLLFQFQNGAETFYDMMAPLRNMDLRDAAIVSPLKMLCATELEAFYRFFEDSARQTDISARMRSCAKYLRGRQTSKAEDEPLCVPTIMGLDPSLILAGGNSFEERMERFYKTVRQFDQRIIFNDHPRLQRDGFHWAPRSFLRQLPPDLITAEDSPALQRPPVEIFPNGGGLPVTFPGFEIHNNSGSQLGTSLLILPNMDAVPMLQQQNCNYFPDKIPWWKCFYKLQIKPDNGENFAWDPKQRYVVIMYVDFHKDLTPVVAILATVEPSMHLQHVGPDPFTQADFQAKTELDQTMYAPNPNLWLPLHSVPQRVTVRHVCRATVYQISREELDKQKSFLEPHINRVMQEKMNQSVQGIFRANRIIGQQKGSDSLPQIPPGGMHPVLATVYSRVQRWCVL